MNEETDSTAAAWVAFINYAIKHAPLEHGVAAMSILVEGNVPLAWNVRVEPTQPFYVDDSGDVRRQWMAFVRHVISRCKDNRGFAVVDAEHIVINGGRPLLWIEAALHRIHPMEMVSDAGREVILKTLYPNFVRHE